MSSSTTSPAGRAQQLFDEGESEKRSSGAEGLLSRSLPNPSFDMYHHHHYYAGSEDHFDYSRLKLDDLEFVATLGVGGFGRVELCKVKKSTAQ